MPDRKAMRHAWTVDDVIAYLGSLGLSHVSEPFRANGVDGALLETLSEADLTQELGLTKLQARKVFSRLPRV